MLLTISFNIINLMKCLGIHGFCECLIPSNFSLLLNRSIASMFGFPPSHILRYSEMEKQPEFETKPAHGAHVGNKEVSPAGYLGGNPV